MDALAAARAVLPLWPRELIWFAGPALGLLWFGVSVMALRLPPVPADPWWERARLLYPWLVNASSFRTMSLTMALAILAVAGNSWAIGLSPACVPWTLVTAWLGPTAAGLRLERQIVPRPWRGTIRSWSARTLALSPGVWGLVLLSGTTLIRGAPGLAAGLAAWFVVFALSAGGGFRIARRLGLARPAGERVRGAVLRAAQRLGIQPKEIAEFDWAAANALAFPISRRVVFTSEAARVLDDAELEAVASHELGHLAEPWGNRIARPLILSSLTALFLVGPHLIAVSWLSALVAAGIIVAELLLFRVVAWRGERHADSHAQDGAGVYATALEKIYRANLVPAVLRRAGQHGHLYDRLVAAGRPPAWPRPPPPGQAPFRARVFLLVGLFPPVVFGAMAMAEMPSTVTHAYWQLALGSESAWTVEFLARDAARAGRAEEAVTLYRAACRLEPDQPFLESGLIVALGKAGQCPDALALLAEVEIEVRGRPLRSDEDQALSAARAAGIACANGAAP